MTLAQFIAKLNAIAKANPDALHRPVAMVQYDEVFADDMGRVEVTDLDNRHDAIVIS